MHITMAPDAVLKYIRYGCNIIVSFNIRYGDDGRNIVNGVDMLRDNNALLVEL